MIATNQSTGRAIIQEKKLNPEDSTICTWARDVEQYKDEWSCIDWYRWEMELILKPLWTWQKIYCQYYYQCKWWKIVSGNPHIGPTGDLLEDICSQMRIQRRSTDDHPLWRMQFSTKLNDKGKAKYLAVITLPWWELVHMYSLYEEFVRQLSLTSRLLEERWSYERVYLSKLRKRKRESVKWNRFVESLISR